MSSGDQIQVHASRYSSSLLEAPFDRLNIQVELIVTALGILGIFTEPVPKKIN